jgi:hypothetical protein
MALRLVPDHVDIPSGSGGKKVSGGKALEVKKINTAQVALKGFNLSFSNGDNPIKNIRINLIDVAHAGNDVEYTVDVQYQDKTNTDNYNGRVEVLIIADVEV